MVRTIPAGRLKQLIDAATQVFIAEGYRRTQMEDVAAALGVAKGTLYGYVESKAALFDGALRYADGHEALPETSELPLRVAPEGSLSIVSKRLASEVGGLELVAALGRAAPKDVPKELGDIIRDLYRRAELLRVTDPRSVTCAVTTGTIRSKPRMDTDKHRNRQQLPRTAAL